MQIDFHPGINLLIGDNGVGKTSILEALTIALGGFLSGVAGVSSKGILQPQYDKAYEILEAMKASYGEDNSEVKNAVLELELENYADTLI